MNHLSYIRPTLRRRPRFNARVRRRQRLRSCWLTGCRPRGGRHPDDGRKRERERARGRGHYEITEQMRGNNNNNNNSSSSNNINNNNKDHEKVRNERFRAWKMKMLYGLVEDQESFQSVVCGELRDLGIKVPKANKSANGTQPMCASLFGGCLSRLPSVSVLQDDLLLQIPKFLLMATSLIRQNLKAEGLFRKGGSIQRQRELKQSLEDGGDLDGNANVHDVANLVKQFLRCLSEPLLQPRLHEPLVKAHDMADADAVFLLCALLPVEHLHALRFLMAFFAEIASHTAHNKMDSESLAIVLMPNLFVLPRELDKKDKCKEKLLQKKTGLVKFLIDNFDRIGSVCDRVMDKARAAAAISDDDLDGGSSGVETRAKLTAKKKRNSLNGVFYGLRKMVQQNRIPSICNDEAEFLDGPSVERTPGQAMKRRHVGGVNAAAGGCSSAKKRTLMALKSEKPLPIPMTHVDSPDPGRNDEDISTNPGSFLDHRGQEGDSRKRKSSRMKFFGKAYLARRASLSRSPKPTKQEKKALSSCKKQAATLRLKPIVFPDASPTHLTAPQPMPSPKSYRSILYTKNKSTSPVCRITLRSDCKQVDAGHSMVAESHLKVAKGRNKVVTTQTQPSSASSRRSSSMTALPKKSALAPGREGGGGGAAGAKWFQAATIAACQSNNSVNKMEGMHRMRSFVTECAAATASPMGKFASPIRAVIWRPLVKSSLRRGRPNTVRAGLPEPSPFKGSVVGNPGMAHYTSDPGPMIDPDQLRSRNETGSESSSGLNHESVAAVVERSGPDNRSDGADIAEPPGSGYQPDRTRKGSSAGSRNKPSVVSTDAFAGVQKVLDFAEEEEGSSNGGDEVFARQVERLTSSFFNRSTQPRLRRGNVEAEPQLRKCDSGIFDFEACVAATEDREPPEEPMDVENFEVPTMTADPQTMDVESPPCKSPSIDSGFHPSEYGGDVRDPTSTVTANETAPFFFASPRGKVDGIVWRSAATVFGSGGGGCAATAEESAAAGRTSLLRLMKDKAGSVTATARKYDEIARSVERRHSLRAVSPMVRNRALPQHRRSVSRDAIAVVGHKTRIMSTDQESKENMPRGGATATKATVVKHAAVLRQRQQGGGAAAGPTANATPSRINGQMRSTAAVRRSKSSRSSDDRSIAAAAGLRRSPRIKLSVVRDRRSSAAARRSTTM